MNMAGGRVSVGQFRYASRTTDFASLLRAFAGRLEQATGLQNGSSAAGSSRA
jgi:hypothetical protein